MKPIIRKDHKGRAIPLISMRNVELRGDNPITRQDEKGVFDHFTAYLKEGADSGVSAEHPVGLEDVFGHDGESSGSLSEGLTEDDLIPPAEGGTAILRKNWEVRLSLLGFDTAQISRIAENAQKLWNLSPQSVALGALHQVENLEGSDIVEFDVPLVEDFSDEALEI